MEQRLSLVTLGVMDLDRSRAFYERLGWRRTMPSAAGVKFFQLGGIALALYRARTSRKMHSRGRRLRWIGLNQSRFRARSGPRQYRHLTSLYSMVA